MIVSWQIYASIFMLASALWMLSPINGFKPNKWMTWSQRISGTILVLLFLVAGLDVIWAVEIVS